MADPIHRPGRFTLHQIAWYGSRHKTGTVMQPMNIFSPIEIEDTEAQVRSMFLRHLGGVSA